MDSNKLPDKKESKLAITDKNWKMLKAIESGKTVKDAYYLAGYKGTDENAAYQLYWQLKKRLEAVYEADNIDSLRLKIAAKKILDMPVEDKPVKPEVKLRAIETLSKLTEKERKEPKTITPFVVFKDNGGQITATTGQVVTVENTEDLRDKEDREID